VHCQQDVAGAAQVKRQRQDKSLISWLVWDQLKRQEYLPIEFSGCSQQPTSIQNNCKKIWILNKKFLSLHRQTIKL